MATHAFDLVVVGTGTGLDVANWAAQAGWSVAIVEKDRLGGTCLNRGCIPSKLLLHSADVVRTIQRAHLFGIHVKGYEVDWPAIVRRVTASVDGDSDGISEAFKEVDNPRLFRGEGRFVGPQRMRVGGDELTAPKWLLASGARPEVPALEGLRDVPFMTSTEALRLEKQPKSMVILGGGYIAAEMAHFYGSLGTDVTIIHRRPHLLPREDRDVSRAFTALYQERFRLLLDHEARRVWKEGDGIAVEAHDKARQAKAVVKADALLVAVGVRSNADLLDVAKAGVKTREDGFIEVDGNLRTSAEGIYALGDAIGGFLFKHAANHEGVYAWQNLANPDDQVPVDYHGMPHAIFADPQVAAVGLTEEECRDRGEDYVASTYRYRDTAMGRALEEDHGFVKFLVERGSGHILGCHILGPEASTLIHEVIVAMKAGDGNIRNILRSVFVHPALSEVVQRAAPGLEEIGPPEEHEHAGHEGHLPRDAA